MQNNPLVSVIIPAFNAEKHIEGCIRSVLAQSWQNIEIIVVDDGSSDNTPGIAGSFGKQGVRLVMQKNLGGCAARNKGFEVSQGDYIQFLDADDLISDEKIELQVKALLENPGRVAVCTTVHFMDGDNPGEQPVPDESEYLFTTSDTADFYATLWGGGGKMHMVQTSAWLLERSLIEKSGNWNTEILLDQDGEFFSRAVLASRGICFTGGRNYYRKYPAGANVSGKYSQHKYLSSAIEAAEMKAGNLLKVRDDERARRAAANLFMQLAIDAYPAYPDLYEKAMARTRQLHPDPVVPILGGLVIEMIKYLFGWKTAKKIRYNYHRMIA